MTPKTITSQIKQILEALKKAAEGDYSARLDVSAKDDETGLIADAVNEMLKNAGRRMDGIHEELDSLRKDSKRYRNILENIEEYYLETDLRGNFIFFNDTLCRMLGYTREELQNINYRRIIPPEQNQHVFATTNEVYRTGKTKNIMHHTVLTKDGSIRHIERSIVLMRSATGEPIGFSGIGRDVTNRLETERIIQQNERHLRLITDNIRDIIWTMDFNLCFTYLSPSVLHITGFTPEQVIKMPLTSLLPPDTHRMVEQMLDEELNEELSRESRGEAIDQKKTVTFELQIMRKTGEYFWVENRISFNRDENGKPFEILGVTRDISERKKAEEALRESEKLYRMIVENMSDAIATLDLNLQYTYQSPSIQRITGYSLEELKHLTARERLTPESRVMVEKILAEALNYDSRKKPRRFGTQTLEVEAYHKDGGTVWLEITATFTRDENDNVTGLLITSKDISQRRKTAQEKDKLEKQLVQAQKMETIGRLAGGIAHDFNNMLSVILGYADLAKLRLSDNHPVLNDIAEIKKAAIRSRNITTQLLAFSRKQIISPKVIDLNEMITHTNKALVSLIGEDVHLTCHLEENLRMIKIDPSQIEQILMNLAVNARDAMPGGGRLTIATTNMRADDFYCGKYEGFTPGDYVCLSVSDNGTGMDKDILLNIFEPFFTNKETGKGTGLGLATVYGIVKQNNGVINVYSEPAYGTTFNIYLPATTMRKNVQGEPEKEQVLTGKGSILLVEDDPMVLKITEGMLEYLGYDVIVANTPMEAIAICENPAIFIDLVISDVVMPVMSGKELRNKLAGIRPGIKVLFMSGYPANIIAHHGVLEEGVQFIEKPFTLESLSAKVADATAAERASQDRL